MKTKKVMQKLLQGLLVVMVIIVSLCGSALAEQDDPMAQTEPAAQAQKGWYGAIRLGFQPYTIEMSGKAGNRDFDAKADLADIMDKTDTIILGGEVEFGTGKFFMILNGFYQKSETDSGDNIYGIKSKFTEMGFNPLVGYRVYQGDGGTPVFVDVMAGVYYVSLSAEVEVFNSLLGNISRDRDFNFTDAMVGARAYYGFTKKFGASVFGEIGGGGSELQYVAAANLVYNFTDWFAASVGYKYWYFKYKGDEQILSELEQKLHGPTLGVQFKF